MLCMFYDLSNGSTLRYSHQSTRAITEAHAQRMRTRKLCAEFAKKGNL